MKLKDVTGVLGYSTDVFGPFSLLAPTSDPPFGFYCGATYTDGELRRPVKPPLTTHGYKPLLYMLLTYDRPQVQDLQLRKTLPGEVAWSMALPRLCGALEARESGAETERERRRTAELCCERSRRLEQRGFRKQHDVDDARLV